jgi:hypothetical protein
LGTFLPNKSEWDTTVLVCASFVAREGARARTHTHTHTHNAYGVYTMRKVTFPCGYEAGFKKSI